MFFGSDFFYRRFFPAVQCSASSVSPKLGAVMANRQIQEGETQMQKEVLEATIAAQLNEVRNKTLNRNALSALFGAFADPVGALGKIFLGRDDAVDAEKHRIERACILDLLCDIDEALVKMQASSAAQGVTINGLIEATGTDVESVVAVNIQKDGPPVRFEPGTIIRAKGSDSGKVTGLQIGGSAPKGDN